MANKSIDKKFEEIIHHLNPEQRRAVEHIHGPAMVVAGPGTGKTQLLTARIGYLLQQPDVTPQEILCLTYTDAGTIAMRERLKQMIGSDAYRVNIHTFHSFCNELISNHIEIFGSHELDLVSELELLEIGRKLIDTLPHNSPLLSSREKYANVKPMLNLFTLMKEENWTSEDIVNAVENEKEALKTDPDFLYKRKQGNFNAGDLKQNKYDEAVLRIEKTSAAARLFDTFLTEMNNANRFEYIDMLMWVKKAFENHEYLLEEVQEQYQYFLVDEFQDTNGIQMNILEKMIGYWDSPNIFVVGDDDQSIYGFQGARIENLIQFHNRYQPELKTIVMKQNYRSSSAILDTAHQLIQHNNIRITSQVESLEDKEIIAAGKYKDHSLTPQLTIYENDIQESIGVYKSIQKLIAEGVKPEEIAVLYTKHSESDMLIKLFNRFNIPYYAKRYINVLETTAFQQVKLITQFLEKEHRLPFQGESELFSMLHLPCLGISYMDIRKLIIFIQQNKNANTIRYFDLLGDKTWLEELEIQSIENILSLHQTLVDLLSKWKVISAAKMLEMIINRLGLLKQVIHTKPDNESLRVLHTLIEFTKTETKKRGWMSLAELFNLFDVMKKESLVLPIMDYFVNKNSIQLLTVHGSKGLEFEHVFMIGSTEKNWEPSKAGGYQFKLPQTLIFEDANSNTTEERRRLFYVGITRAKIGLYFSYPKRKSTLRKEQNKARFINESIPSKEIIFEENTIIEFIEPLIDDFDIEIKITENKDWIQAVVNSHVISISSLNSWLDCPIQWFYRNVLRIPMVMSEYTVYGNAIHHALAMAYANVKQDNRQLLATDKVIEIFENEIREYEYVFEKGSVDHALKRGTERIIAYLDYLEATHLPLANIEKFIDGVVIRNIPIKGTIDRIDFENPTQVRIIDIKTGKSNSIKKASIQDVEKGRLLRQLAFYKLLVDEKYNLQYDVISTELHYLEDLPELKFIKGKEITNDMKDELKDLIEKVSTEIKSMEFVGCGKDTCKYCNLEKQIQSDSLYPDDVAELDD